MDWLSLVLLQRNFLMDPVAFLLDNSVWNFWESRERLPRTFWSWRWLASCLGSWRIGLYGSLVLDSKDFLRNKLLNRSQALNWLISLLSLQAETGDSPSLELFWTLSVNCSRISIEQALTCDCTRGVRILSPEESSRYEHMVMRPSSEFGSIGSGSTHPVCLALLVLCFAKLDDPSIQPNPLLGIEHGSESCCGPAQKVNPAFLL